MKTYSEMFFALALLAGSFASAAERISCRIDQDFNRTLEIPNTKPVVGFHITQTDSTDELFFKWIGEDKTDINANVRIEEFEIDPHGEVLKIDVKTSKSTLLATLNADKTSNKRRSLGGSIYSRYSGQMSLVSVGLEQYRKIKCIVERN